MSASDLAKQRAMFVDRLREAGPSTQRFINVHDGENRPTNHTQHEPDTDEFSDNYGVYGGLGDGETVTGETRWLVDVDVDDYADTDGETEGLDSFPKTFTVESPHTDGESGDTVTMW